MRNEYVGITKALFRRHLEEECGGSAFITQDEIAKKFCKTVATLSRDMGELFVSEVCIITEKCSPLAITTITHIARCCGYAIAYENYTHAIKYLNSDGGGHYSTDYYRYLEYGLIRVTLLQS